MMSFIVNPVSTAAGRGADAYLPRLPTVLLMGLLAGVTCRAADDTPRVPRAATLTAPIGAAPGTLMPTPGAASVNTAAAASPLANSPPNAASPAATPAPSPSGTDSAQTAEDIRDIRGPKFALPPWMIVAAILGAALLALVVYGIWRWRQRRRRPRVLLPFEQALQQLDGIRPLMQPASAREFSIAVSDIVRVYIEQRFDVVATHRTTEEFMHDLLQTPKPSLARHRGLLAEFLQQCDLVKFGGMSLSMDSIEALHHGARGFVLETAKPDPVTLPNSAHPKNPAGPTSPTNPKEAHDTLPAA